VANSLLLRVATGDTVAVEQCIERFGGLAWSLARRFSANPSDADDAVQEIFIELWRSASRYDEAIGSEATFVTMIARRCLVNRFRQQRRRPETTELPADLPAVVTGQLDPVEQADEVARIAEEMRRLRPEQQAVLKMSIYDGLSHDAIAKSMGIPLGTVKTHARRGLFRIREAMSGAIQDGAKEGTP
jgi:RNA polymerase sigma factor (sigma-70 family)